MKPLPLGIRTFSNLIEGNYLYVDKTKEIFTLISEGIYYFLSRPRRFGKSLLISTLKEIFLGNRKLFKGLYIYDKITWKSHPIIQLKNRLIILYFSDNIDWKPIIILPETTGKIPVKINLYQV